MVVASKRRHTRYWRDWSSDVCSSDLQDPREGSKRPYLGAILHLNVPSGSSEFSTDKLTGDMKLAADWALAPRWSLGKFGSAPCRASAQTSVVAVSLKNHYRSTPDHAP